MRHQVERRDSKQCLVVDEDCGIPSSLVESYRSRTETGPRAQQDPRSYLLSMSDYDKTQSYDVYDYQTATRPEQGQHAYGAFAAHPSYAADYVAAQAQVPSGLPQSSTTIGLVPPAQQYATHDPAYYGQQVAQYPAYLEQPARQVPTIQSYTPNSGPPGTQVTIYFYSPYDFDAPRVTPIIMFGTKRCESVLTKTPHEQGFQYSLQSTTPSLTDTHSPTPEVPIRLIMDDSAVSWDSPPNIDIGNFTYLDPPTYYALDSPQMTAAPLQAPRKRKLSSDASPRRSPAKKPSMQQFPQSYAQSPSAQYKRPSAQDVYQHGRRYSSGTSEYQNAYNPSMSRMPSHQYYGQSASATPSLTTSQSPSWSSYAPGVQTTRSPSMNSLSAHSKSSHLLPSPAGGVAPPLIRTSTLHGSPTTPGASMTSTPVFNPYTVYPSNTKAMLKIEGDLNKMADGWTAAEWEAGRRLVQFRRSQSGSVISATFEPVTLEDRLPNSICVSCIWWEEKQECYVTSVDTISLLESLVAVRFTVEEKNRIRRNLEGFRPATVSKTKADSEAFFKAIMAFPNPKPRNIEKDVKVFPWRILATALKKIIGKYSASYSSTAGVLHAPGSSAYAVSRPSDVGIDQRTAASPRSASSSAASHHAYAPPQMSHNVYHGMPAGLGIGPSGHPDPRLSVPTSAGAQPMHYSSELGYSNFSYLASPATGLPGTAQQSYAYQQRIPSLTGPTTIPAEARFVPLQDYEGHQTSTA
ncbi:hypothetical protein CB0940_03482 [Cercospora beticola]|uniref:DUF7082 domain-containing protein n=1 Tax=Cercospora beticola TaxID=122368 RepID=A0A2G5I1U2_CERBT|nr:hypothetical protein CB0940_03482 [Cercospora beticola]PIA98711.1 hypothetical protein CB0940_03482 [Cercospora beticola]WPB00656.1 hypothetical protein RHO25_005276 [Cercospora beticola]CAK1361109.1 unnamed protein product [Cercospora beticola]